jgi:ribosomal protein S18 acetylase RimI-like enzyme
MTNEPRGALFHVKHSPQICPAKAADVQRIAAIARAAYAKYVPRIGREPPPMVADFACFIAREVVVVIEDGGELRGFMIAWPEADAYLVDNVAVDPAAQGRGLGRKLFEHAVSEARRAGLSALRLYTNVAMTENLAMYRRIGFVETHRAIENGLNRVYMRWDFPSSD